MIITLEKREGFSFWRNEKQRMYLCDQTLQFFFPQVAHRNRIYLIINARPQKDSDVRVEVNKFFWAEIKINNHSYCLTVNKVTMQRIVCRLKKKALNKLPQKIVVWVNIEV